MNDQPREADAYTYLVDVMGEPKKQVVTANSIIEARLKADSKWGDGRVRHIQVHTPEGRQPESTLHRTKTSPRYSNRGKELLSAKQFREHMTKLVNFYCEESQHDDGPGWASKFKSVERIAVDFAKFVQALDGEVK
jgi:hypothetical protein